jgi:hypothetical protein
MGKGLRLRVASSGLRSNLAIERHLNNLLLLGVAH